MPPPRRTLALVALIALSSLARPGGSQPLPSGAPTIQASSGRPDASAQAAPAPAPRREAPLDLAQARARLEKLAAEVQRWGGRAGAMAIDVESGATLLSLDERGLYNPASNAKLLTAAAALRVLGPGHRYLTGLYGSLSGDAVPELALRGAGDPSLETRDLWELARQLRAAGVRKVGSIAVDQGYFDDRYVPPAFDQQPNEWAAFRAPVAAVSLNANTVLFTVRAAASGEPASVSVDPPGVVELKGHVSTAGKGTPEKLLLDLEPRGDRLTAKLGGSVPEGSRLVQVARRVDDPRLLAGHALREVLEELGIRVTGEIRLGGSGQKRLLAARRSLPLSALLHPVGKDSDNFYAEMVFKSLAASARGRPGTAEAAAEVVSGVVGEMGAAEPALVVKNGSGLFDANRASARSLATLLRAAYRDPALGADFVAQLAIGGVDGTLRARFRSWSGRRAIRAKTGTLEGVAALSGYVLAPPGRSPVSFSILVNGIPGKVGEARRGMDRVVDAIAAAIWDGAP